MRDGAVASRVDRRRVSQVEELCKEARKDNFTTTKIMADNFSKRLEEFKGQIFAIVESSAGPSAQGGDTNLEGGTASLQSSPYNNPILRQQDLDFDMMTECVPSRNDNALISALGRA